MASKRENNRIQRRDKILNSAIQAFRENGYQNTRMETVAEMSGLAIGTLYNYYRNKGDLLLAILTLDFQEERDRIKALAEDSNLTLDTCARQVVLTFFEGSFTLVDRHMLREAIATLIHDPSTQFAKAYQKDIARFQRDLKNLFRIVAERSPDAQDIDTDFFAETLFSAVNLETILYCIGTSDDFAPHVATLNRLVDELLNPAERRPTSKHAAI